MRLAETYPVVYFLAIDIFGGGGPSIRHRLTAFAIHEQPILISPDILAFLSSLLFFSLY
jgi:hypothetical protein|eukprot:SAG25_NODE_535_length_7114_cov_2.609408_7_plen_59_part_00